MGLIRLCTANVIRSGRHYAGFPFFHGNGGEENLNIGRALIIVFTLSASRGIAGGFPWPEVACNYTLNDEGGGFIP